MVLPVQNDSPPPKLWGISSNPGILNGRLVQLIDHHIQNKTALHKEIEGWIRTCVATALLASVWFLYYSAPLLAVDASFTTPFDIWYADYGRYILTALTTICLIGSYFCSSSQDRSLQRDKHFRILAAFCNLPGQLIIKLIDRLSISSLEKLSAFKNQFPEAIFASSVKMCDLKKAINMSVLRISLNELSFEQLRTAAHYIGRQEVLEECDAEQSPALSVQLWREHARITLLNSVDEMIGAIQKLHHLKEYTYFFRSLEHTLREKLSKEDHHKLLQALLPLFTDGRILSFENPAFKSIIVHSAISDPRLDTGEEYAFFVRKVRYLEGELLDVPANTLKKDLERAHREGLSTLVQSVEYMIKERSDEFSTKELESFIAFYTLDHPLIHIRRELGRRLGTVSVVTEKTLNYIKDYRLRGFVRYSNSIKPVFPPNLNNMQSWKNFQDIAALQEFTQQFAALQHHPENFPHLYYELAARYPFCAQLLQIKTNIVQWAATVSREVIFDKWGITIDKIPEEIRIACGLLPNPPEGAV